MGLQNIIVFPEGSQLTANMVNLRINDIVTPIKVHRLWHFLNITNYDKNESKFLIQGFTRGFSLEYQGPLNRADVSNNIPLTVGTPMDLWQKVMKEVQLGRVAGPFNQEQLPKFYVQSPIGLVPKANGKLRLIFHLSYEFKNGNPSINRCTPREYCAVHYNDTDHAIGNCAKFRNKVFWAKTDVESAFRVMPLLVKHRFLLVMKCKKPGTNTFQYFIKKNLPSGHSISF